MLTARRQEQEGAQGAGRSVGPLGQARAQQAPACPPASPAPLAPCSPSPPLQSKDKLLEEMQASVAGDQEVALKRLLGEDQAVMKRREALTLKLDMLKKAQAELTSVDV